ncbi:MAG TPA: glycosyltransferase family 2 protein [Bacteroidia bacterium]|nr:glycosyltransferase family 2 protein [Bacteroidia bacterium]
MFISGFTFVRNAIRFDYPVVESITSILDLCDEFIVLVGNSEDGTREIIQNINSEKIKIFDSTWDDSLREGGRVLAVETDKAFSKISEKSDWCFYLQADEVVHEKYLPIIKDAMLKCKTDHRVEGLLFNYLHFYGSYDFIAGSRKWYRKEIRVIRNDKKIQSFRDAQGFRKNGRKLNVKPIDAYIYHYGWVKSPGKQQDKQKSFHKHWHDDEWLKKNVGDAGEFDYSKIDSLKVFEGTHPETMLQRISEKNWKFNFDPSKNNFSVKDRLLTSVEKISGWRMGEYKNYKIV